MQTADKKLLILDFDETLIFAEETPLNRQADFRVGQYFVYQRPALAEFIEFCVENFEVAVWTASTRNYATKIVEEIFPNPNKLAFFWSRARCTISLEAEEREPFLEKKMWKVRRRGYDLSQVKVVDDLPQVWRKSYGNLICLKPFWAT